MEEPKPRVIKRYKKRNDKEPFSEWLKKVRDKTIVKSVLDHLERVRLGDLGQNRRLGEYLLELKLKSGIRIYCADIDNVIIVLLCAGDKNNKSEQSCDIAKAEEYWADFMEQEDEDANTRTD